MLWNLEVAETHVGRSHSSAWDICSADLQVNMILLLIKILSNFIYSIYLQPKSNVHPIFNVIDSRTLRSYCGGRGNNALQVNYQGFD